VSPDRYFVEPVAQTLSWSIIRSMFRSCVLLTVSDGHLDFNAFASLMSRSRAKNAEEAKRREEHEMRQAFRVFDRDGNGVIDEKELRTTMKNLGENLSKNDVKAMIKAADKNGDGKIDYEGLIHN